MNSFQSFFELYDQQSAPFMHTMVQDYKRRKPFAGMTIAHNVPLTQTTLLKIACLKASGATVTVTNPSFVKESPLAINTLTFEGIQYKPLDKLEGSFDFLLDCGAELIKNCHAQRGIVELTRTGAMHYEKLQSSEVPIVSVDDTRLKSLETCLGTGEGVFRAITELHGKPNADTKVLIFGFGKVGTGIAYYFSQKTPSIAVIDMLPERLEQISSRGYEAVSAELPRQVEAAINKADIIITATGIKNLLSLSYKKEWFSNKVLANAGAEDEFGFNFSDSEVLANKKPVNFALQEPTLMPFLDPIFYAHNLAIEDALQVKTPGFKPLNKKDDQRIVEQWARLHSWSLEDLNKTF